ncbi:type I restriction-modification system subunit M N-terminal domain-containing protein [Sorangium sp. So ce296]|uniref:type I restriction-modification system subunit M n=1 Tax=Sorangium sp. So ce296 TaxID=3133296 RepID=UPI003F640BA3
MTVATNVTVRQVLDRLTRDELIAAVDLYGIEVADRRAKAALADALARSPQVDLGDALGRLSRDRLKQLCRDLSLDDSGREKAALVGRLLPRQAKANGQAGQMLLPLSGGSHVAAASASTMTTSTPTPPPPSPRSFASFREITDFLWQNAERLRGAYKPNEYDKVILPLLVIRRLDCVLEPTKQKVLARLADLTARGMKPSDPAVDKALRKVSGVPFYNVHKLDFVRLKGDPSHIAQNLRAYLKGFSANARDIVEQFKFDEQINRLDEANLLYQVVELFAGVDVHPDAVPNHVMGSIFEELIRKFNEKKNEEAGDHYTPREIIRLMVDLLFVEDDDALRRPGIVRSLFDPACGTGGMLSVAEEYLRELNPDAC